MDNKIIIGIVLIAIIGLVAMANIAPTKLVEINPNLVRVAEIGVIPVFAHTRITSSGLTTGGDVWKITETYFESEDKTIYFVQKQIGDATACEENKPVGFITPPIQRLQDGTMIYEQIATVGEGEKIPYNYYKLEPIILGGTAYYCMGFIGQIIK